MASRITVSDHLDESSHKDLDLLSLDSLSSLGTTTPGFSSHDGQVPLQVKLVTTLEQLTATLHSARIEDPQNECVKRQEQILLGVLKDVVDLGGGEEKTRRESQESVTQTKKEDEKKLREEYHLQLNKAESERVRHPPPPFCGLLILVLVPFNADFRGARWFKRIPETKRRVHQSLSPLFVSMSSYSRGGDFSKTGHPTRPRRDYQSMSHVNGLLVSSRRLHSPSS